MYASSFKQYKQKFSGKSEKKLKDNVLTLSYSQFPLFTFKVKRYTIQSIGEYNIGLKRSCEEYFRY